MLVGLELIIRFFFFCEVGLCLDIWQGFFKIFQVSLFLVNLLKLKKNIFIIRFVEMNDCIEDNDAY